MGNKINNKEIFLNAIKKTIENLKTIKEQQQNKKSCSESDVYNNDINFLMRELKNAIKKIDLADINIEELILENPFKELDPYLKTCFLHINFLPLNAKKPFLEKTDEFFITCLCGKTFYNLCKILSELGQNSTDESKINAFFSAYKNYILSKKSYKTSTQFENEIIINAGNLFKEFKESFENKTPYQTFLILKSISNKKFKLNGSFLFGFPKINNKIKIVKSSEEIISDLDKTILKIQEKKFNDKSKLFFSESGKINLRIDMVDYMSFFSAYYNFINSGCKPKGKNYADLFVKIKKDFESTEAYKAANDFYEILNNKDKRNSLPIISPTSSM